ADTSRPTSGWYGPSYVTGAWLAWKKNVRNVPVATRITKQNRAISPSRNDQWSGKTLRSAVRAMPNMPVRASTHCPRRSSSVGCSAGASAADGLLVMGDVPEAGTDRVGEVAERHERPVGGHPDRQLRQRPRGRAVDRLRPDEHVELALVAGADQRVLRRPVQ